MNYTSNLMERLHSINSDNLPVLADGRLVKSKTIVENQEQLLLAINAQADIFEKTYGHRNFNSSYWTYNIFSLVERDLHMYNLLSEVKRFVRTVIPDGRPLWAQAWLNMHTQSQVLDWHIHSVKWSGYICIDPKKTETIFESFKIKNEVGNMYFGTGGEAHKVQVLEPYSGYRITLGFDVTDETKDYGNISDNRMNLGLMPI